MQKAFFILIGRSGSGKSTQVELIKMYLLENNMSDSFLSVSTGSGFRSLAESDNYTAKLVVNYLNGGRLCPESLAVWNWSNTFIHSLKENDTVLLDGAPRKLLESYVLESAVKFYGYKDVIVVYLETDTNVVEDRLIKRGRDDDTKSGAIEEKMDWFDRDVLPVVEYYQSNSFYKVLEIDGNQAIEEVTKDIIKKFEKCQQ